ncbi:MAG: YdcF family protein [Armatimonadota bacterium]|nr:YdcF family protein [Armatimonadota bacterium]MDR7536507.1 YdcF family protein [Armatimonadota bacterium]
MRGRHSDSTRLRAAFVALVAATGLAAVGFALSTPAMEALGGFLVVHDAGATGEAAVVLSGDAMRDRLRAALALARHGAVRHVIVLTGTPPDFYDERAAVLAFARRHGVAPERVVLVGAAHSTVDDARLAVGVMRARGWRRAVVVTSAYHTRRATLAFCGTWRPMGLQASTYAVEDRGFVRRGWWRHDAAREAVVLEYVKLAAYAVRYGPVCR